MIVISFLCCSSSNAASFDCTKAKSQSEKLICDDPQLSALDDDLSLLYKKARSVTNDKDAFNTQNKTEWSNREKDCKNKTCMLLWYEHRKNQLIEIINKTNYNQKDSDSIVKSNQQPDSSAHELKVLITGLKNKQILSYKDAFSEAHQIKLLKQKYETYPIAIDFYFNQVKFDLDVLFINDLKVKLPFEFPIGSEQTDAGFLEKESNSYFFGQYDFNNDGIDEIIFGVVAVDSDDIPSVAVNIYSYTSPANPKDVTKLKNWTLEYQLVANGILGDVGINFQDRSVTIPRNLRGFYFEASWLKDHFVDTGDY